jgi:hypothetical protein
MASGIEAAEMVVAVIVVAVKVAPEYAVAGSAAVKALAPRLSSHLALVAQVADAIVLGRLE